MTNKILYLSEKDIIDIIDQKYDLMLDVVSQALIMFHNNQAILPDKISMILDDQSQNRINTMSAFLNKINVAGVKWISVFPSNDINYISNVEGYSILSETVYGKVKCILNSSETTKLRTAAIGALAAKYLARKNSQSVGFIGAGEQAKSHFKLLKHVFKNIKTCYISSRTEKSVLRFIEEMANFYDDVNFINCRNCFEQAIVDADIIVTAISSQEPVLKAKWIKDGAFYIHVAGLEDEFAVAQKATKIVVDHWDSVKHRSQTICQMYKQGLLADHDIYADLAEIIIGQKNGRENDKEFIYFNSVGLSVIDILFSEVIYNQALKQNKGIWLEK